MSDLYSAYIGDSAADIAHYGRKGMRKGMNIFNPDYVPIGEVARNPGQLNRNRGNGEADRSGWQQEADRAFGSRRRDIREEKDPRRRPSEGLGYHTNTESRVASKKPGYYQDRGPGAPDPRKPENALRRPRNGAADKDPRKRPVGEYKGPQYSKSPNSSEAPVSNHARQTTKKFGTNSERSKDNGDKESRMFSRKPSQRLSGALAGQRHRVSRQRQRIDAREKNPELTTWRPGNITRRMREHRTSFDNGEYFNNRDAVRRRRQRQQANEVGSRYGYSANGPISTDNTTNSHRRRRR